jgi:hypothetical protein
VASKGKSVPPETVTFTPMKLHLKNGVASYENLTMTLRQLDFAFQGDVNLTTKANNLNMTIPGASIAKQFPNLARNFGPGKDIVIPIGGTYDQPTPNLVALAPQIAQFAGVTGGNNASGGNTGNVLQGLGGILGGQKSTPATPAAAPATPTAQKTAAAPAPPAKKNEKTGKVLQGIFQSLGGKNNGAATQASDK